MVQLILVNRQSLSAKLFNLLLNGMLFFPGIIAHVHFTT